MVLVDTSVWINHLQKGSAKLERLLCEAEVASHPFVIGELACGNIQNRKEILSLLKRLPLGPVVENNEFLVAIFVDFSTKMGVLDLLLNKSKSSFQLDCKRDANANENGDDQNKQDACSTLSEQAKNTCRDTPVQGTELPNTTPLRKSSRLTP